MSKWADPFEYCIQHINSNPDVFTKHDCIELIKELKYSYIELKKRRQQWQSPRNQNICDDQKVQK